MTPANGGFVVAGALLGILIVLAAVEWIPRWVTYWRDANEAQEAQIRDALIPRDLGDMK